jgi:hypothetical protein
VNELQVNEPVALVIGFKGCRIDRTFEILWDRKLGRPAKQGDVEFVYTFLFAYDEAFEFGIGFERVEKCFGQGTIAANVIIRDSGT